MWYYFIFSSKFGCRLTDIAECLNKLRLKIFTPGYVILVLKFHKYTLRSFVPLDEWDSLCLCSPPLPFQCCVLVVPPALPCSCHQILANAELKGTFAAVPAAIEPQTNHKPISFPLTEWEHQSHHLLILCLNFVFLSINQKFGFIMCFHFFLNLAAWCVWWGGGKKLRIFSWTLLSCQSMVWVLLLHAFISVKLNLSQKDVLSMFKLSIYII